MLPLLQLLFFYSKMFDSNDLKNFVHLSYECVLRANNYSNCECHKMTMTSGRV